MLFNTNNPSTVSYTNPQFYRPSSIMDKFLLSVAGYNPNGTRNTFGKVESFIPEYSLGSDLFASKKFAGNSGSELNFDYSKQQDVSRGETTVGAGLAVAGALTDNAGLTKTGLNTTMGGLSALYAGGQNKPDTSTLSQPLYSQYKEGGTVTASKAKEILSDGTAQGHPLTEKQKRYFGWIAGGKKHHKKYEDGGEVDFADSEGSALDYGIKNPNLLDYLKTKNQLDYGAKNINKVDYYKVFARGGDNKEDIAMIDKQTGKKVGEVSYGENIFSKEATAVIKSLAKKKDHRELGKFVADELKRQPKNDKSKTFDDGGDIGDDEFPQQIDPGGNDSTTGMLDYPTGMYQPDNTNVASGNYNQLLPTAGVASQPAASGSGFLSGLANGLGGADNIPNAAKFITGLVGASQKLPTWAIPQDFTSYLNRLKDESYEGYSPQERSQALGDIGTSYQADVANIKNTGGGNAAFALGNYGAAINRRNRALGSFNASDAALQKQNEGAYGAALNTNTQLGRQKYEDAYNLAMLNKQSAAKLAQDSLQSFYDQQQFNKQYGTGSLYNQYLQSQVEQSQAQTKLLNNPDYLNQFLSNYQTPQTSFVPAPVSTTPLFSTTPSFAQWLQQSKSQTQY